MSEWIETNNDGQTTSWTTDIGMNRVLSFNEYVRKNQMTDSNLWAKYEKLLAKYNYLLEWSHKQGDLGYSDFDFYRRTFERAYKESLK